MHYTPKRARVFINLYNNQWDTNFPLWQDGSWNSRVRLWVVRGGDAEKNIITPSWEARLPLIAAYANGPRGKLPVEKSRIETVAARRAGHAVRPRSLQRQNAAARVGAGRPFRRADGESAGGFPAPPAPCR